MLTIDSIIINFYDHDKEENYTASLSNLSGDDYPDNLDTSEFAQKVIRLVKQAMEEKDTEQ